MANIWACIGSWPHTLVVLCPKLQQQAHRSHLLIGMTYIVSSCADGLKNNGAEHPNEVIGITRVAVLTLQPSAETCSMPPSVTLPDPVTTMYVALLSLAHGNHRTGHDPRTTPTLTYIHDIRAASAAHTLSIRAANTHAACNQSWTCPHLEGVPVLELLSLQHRAIAATH